MISRYEDALWAGTITPEYCIQRMSSLLCENDSIWMKEDINGFFGRKRLSDYTRVHGPITYPTNPLDEPAPCQAYPGIPEEEGTGKRASVSD